MTSEERRGRGSGQVVHVICRDCFAPVLLDPASMTTNGDRVELRCPGCRATRRVRRTDPIYPALNVIWELCAPGPPTVPQTRGLFRRRPIGRRAGEEQVPAGGAAKRVPVASAGSPPACWVEATDAAPYRPRKETASGAHWQP